MLRSGVQSKDAAAMTCSKLAAGWTSPIAHGDGFVMLEPCPECGVIHRMRRVTIDPKPIGSFRAVEMKSVSELAAHYAHACKGDMERAVLMALDAGYDFTRTVNAFGDDGVRASFQCILYGWIDQGRITEKGRAYLRAGAEA